MAGRGGLSKASIYLAEAYGRLRWAGAALAAASILLVLGVVTLAAGAASYRVYVNPATGEVVPNATAADVVAGRVVEELRVNSTVMNTLLTGSVSGFGSTLASHGGGGGLHYAGYAYTLLLLSILLALVASLNARTASTIFQDYAGIFRAGSLGATLKVAGSLVLLYALWQLTGGVSDGSQAVVLGSLGLYYVGGLLMVAGSILFGVPAILAAREVNADQLVRPAASLHMLGALITFLPFNTAQLIVGPLLCAAAGILYAVSSTRTLRGLR